MSLLTSDASHDELRAVVASVLGDVAASIHLDRPDLVDDAEPVTTHAERAYGGARRFDRGEVMTWQLAFGDTGRGVSITQLVDAGMDMEGSITVTHVVHQRLLAPEDVTVVHRGLLAGLWPAASATEEH